MKRFLIIGILSLGIFASKAQENIVDHIEPLNWWVGMTDPHVQLMIHGDNIGNFTLIEIKYHGVKLEKYHVPENKNYLFLDLLIAPNTKPGVLHIRIQRKDQILNLPYELKARKEGSAARMGFNRSDQIYLLMPDRFANGNPQNDNMPGMLETSNRSNPDGRHGGDIKGIIDHLDYIKKLGATCVWPNPLLENNQSKYSYHGYAISDFYKVDPRFGNNSDYRQMVDEAHKRGLKVIMDVIFNHCGSGHWWMNDLPSANWINQWPEFTRSNYRAGTQTDMHASEYDKRRMSDGWFDQNMPDLNQRNPLLARYLIQNTLWWIEWAGLDGLRVDTYPYPDKDFMARWTRRIRNEYPNLGIVGEAWLNYPHMVAYYQNGAKNADGYNSHLPYVFDFPLYFALQKAFTEDDNWDKGIYRLYEILMQDFVYPHPEDIVIMADNHDLTRFYASVGENMKAWKMGMAFLLTTRGIPVIYYGTELLMSGYEHDGHGQIRKDFPGGWPNDSKNAFTPAGRSSKQNEAYSYLQTLLTWRQQNDAVLNGKLVHYVPENHVYVYFRFTDQSRVMVLINKNKKAVKLNNERYAESLLDYKTAKDVVTGKSYKLANMFIPAESALILELSK